MLWFGFWHILCDGLSIFGLTLHLLHLLFLLCLTGGIAIDRLQRFGLNCRRLMIHLLFSMRLWLRLRLRFGFGFLGLLISLFQSRNKLRLQPSLRKTSSL